jgi:hypothetical protein
MGDDYEINMDDEGSDEELLGSLGEEMDEELVDDDCEIWGFHVLVEEEEAA